MPGKYFDVVAVWGIAVSLTGDNGLEFLRQEILYRITRSEVPPRLVAKEIRDKNRQLKSACS